eukprot:11587732-Alexandrium_andersonii.AAC.1
MTLVWACLGLARAGANRHIAGFDGRSRFDPGSRLPGVRKDRARSSAAFERFRGRKVRRAPSMRT